MQMIVSNARLAPMHVTMIDANKVHHFGDWMSRMKEHTRPASDQHDGIPWENRVISMNLDNLSWMQDIGAYPYLDTSRMLSLIHI